MDEPLIRELLADAYAERGEGTATAHLLLVDDETMRAWNHRYTGRDETTDVLAFDDGEVDPDTGCVHLGDLVVSTETAVREAQARDLNAEDELALYALHGMLHLLGMRDETEDGRAAMAAAQREIFSRHGRTTDT